MMRPTVVSGSGAGQAPYKEGLPAGQPAVSRRLDRAATLLSALWDLAAGTHRQHSVVEGAELRRPWSVMVFA